MNDLAEGENRLEPALNITFVCRRDVDCAEPTARKCFSLISGKISHFVRDDKLVPFMRCDPVSARSRSASRYDNPMGDIFMKRYVPITLFFVAALMLASPGFGQKLRPVTLGLTGRT